MEKNDNYHCWHLVGGTAAVIPGLLRGMLEIELQIPISKPIYQSCLHVINLCESHQSFSIVYLSNQLVNIFLAGPNSSNQIN